MKAKCKQVCKIDYSPALAALAGEGAALLAGMVRSWCRVMKREIWKSNDDLMQELGLSRYQFEQARQAIATRVYAGDSKRELQRVRLDDGSLAPMARIILYWKDRQNRMWYWINEELFTAYCGVPYGLQMAEAKHSQTIENAEAEGSDQQTIITHPKQEQGIDYSISFASEAREELPERADDWRWEHVARVCKLPREIKLNGIQGDLWQVEGVHEAFTALRVLQAEIAKNFGGRVEYRVRAAGVPQWANT